MSGPHFHTQFTEEQAALQEALCSVREAVTINTAVCQTATADARNYVKTLSAVGFTGAYIKIFRPKKSY